MVIADKMVCACGFQRWPSLRPETLMPFAYPAATNVAVTSQTSLVFVSVR